MRHLVVNSFDIRVTVISYSQSLILIFKWVQERSMYDPKSADTDDTVHCLSPDSVASPKVAREEGNDGRGEERMEMGR